MKNLISILFVFLIPFLVSAQTRPNAFTTNATAAADAHAVRAVQDSGLFAQYTNVFAARNDNPFLSGPMAGARIQNKLANGQQVRVIIMGDSWADGGLSQNSAPFRAMNWLATRYGLAGQGMNSIYLAGSLNTYWARRDTNDWLFTYPAFVGYHTDPYPWAKTVQGNFGCLTNYNVNEVGLLYTSQTNGGNIYGRMQGGTPSFTTGSTISLDQTLQLKTMACNITNGTAWFEYGSSGAVGTNCVVGAYMRDTNAVGILPFYFSAGGRLQTDILAVGSNNLSRIGSLLQPDLVLYMAFVNDTDTSPETYSNRTTSIFNAIKSGWTNATIAIVGDPDVISANGSMQARVEMAKQFCTQNGYYYLDLYSSFPSGIQNQAVGITDSLHPTNAYPWAYKLLDLMNLKGF